MKGKARIGIIGMGVMGKSLALNCASKGIEVAVYNRHVPGKEEKIASTLASQHSGLGILSGFDLLKDFIESLQTPRIILLMIPAGPPVDQMIDELLPFLHQGDILIDGGNSYFEDTERRVQGLKKNEVYYMGMGISGGEEGALNGPSLMPGGSERGYVLAQPILTTIAALDKQGKPCTTYVGPGGAGHFVKMVHNGIEYAEMQLLAEMYQILKEKVDTEEIAQFFENCKQEGLSSFLLDITIEILRYRENGELLLNKILDKSKHKGTGKWTVESALNLGYPSSTISEAVMARYVSAEKELRTVLSKHYQKGKKASGMSTDKMKQLMRSYKSARFINHLSGFDLLRKASEAYKWNYNLSEIARIWTNGCIIRSELMEELIKVYANNNLGWTHKFVKEEFREGIPNLATSCAEAFSSGIPVPVLSAALNIFNALTTENSAANLIQAQRDFFGAHTFERIDQPGIHHSDWK